MVMIKDNKGIERYSLSTETFNFLNRAREKIENEDAQVLGIIWGNVGCGKSLLAQKLAFAVDPTLSIDRVCFDKNEFVEAVIHSKKKAIIADEGISMFFSRAAMTKDARLMQELMAQIRQKNLMVLICVPNLLTVDSLILDAANFVIRCWEEKKEINGRLVQTKGNASVFIEMPGDPYKSKVIHYLKNKRSNFRQRMRPPQPLFYIPGNPIGESFSKPWYPVDEKDYRIKKESILEKYQLKNNPVNSSKSSKKENMLTIKKRINIQNALHMKETLNFSIKKIAESLNISSKTASSYVKEGKRENRGTI